VIRYFLIQSHGLAVLPDGSRVDDRSQRFGVFLRRRRLDAGLTQEELADRTGLSVRAISDIERGITSRPHTNSVSMLAQALGIDASGSVELAKASRPRDNGPAPAPDRQVPRQLPPALVSFVGREAEMTMLTGLLDRLGGPPGAVVISAISGTAGVGKTALAVQWAHQVANRFPDGQLYINLRGFDPSRSQMDPADVIRAFLNALGVPADTVPAQADAQVGLYRSLLAERRMLVVLDNARDADQLRTLLPGSADCLALITSRNQLTGLAVSDGAHQMALDVMSQAEACELLTARLGADRASREPAAIDELTELSARLPLALSIAAARATVSAAFPLSSLVCQLRGVRGRLDGLDAGEPTASIRAAFSWSYRQLSPPAARLFRFLGLHPGPDITSCAAASLAHLTAQRARSLLKELSRACLLNQHVPGRYAFHDLLRIYAAERAREKLVQADRLAGLQRMYDHYLYTGFAAAMLLNPSRSPIALPPALPGSAPETMTTLAQATSWFDAEYQVLRNVIAVVADPESEASSDRHAWQIPWTLVNFSDRRGRWDELAAFQRIALTAAERLADPAGQARAHLNIGAASIRMTRYDDALTHLNRSLILFAEIGDRLTQGHNLLAIAEVFAKQGKRRGVLDTGERALALFRAVNDEVGQAFALNVVGLAHLELGHDQHALTYCGQALEMHRMRDNGYGQAESWQYLGQARMQLGQHAAAVDCYEHALSFVGELGDRYNQAWVLEHLGDAYQASGDMGEATSAWRRCLVILEDLNHRDAQRIHAKLQQADGQASGCECEHPTGRLRGRPDVESSAIRRLDGS
jgi:tetratricopeptide (TPR) repeat protein/transcriptional regulator with XRE-family HTH domain